MRQGRKSQIAAIAAATITATNPATALATATLTTAFAAALATAALTTALASPSKSASVAAAAVSAVPCSLVSNQELAFRKELLTKGRSSGHRVCERRAKGTKFAQCLFGLKGQAWGGVQPMLPSKMTSDARSAGKACES